MRFYIETYGCTSNLGDSKEAERALTELGHEPSGEDEADIVIVNTCAVTAKTERKILKRLYQLQGSRLIIAGCLSKALPESFEGLQCKKKMGLLNKSSAKEIASLFEGGSTCRDNRRSRPFKVPLDHLCSIVNIAEGCNGRCSYCIVRRARGNLKSKDPEEIAGEVSRLVGSGIVEIQIAAQDTTSYGLDIGTSLPELLDRIDKIPGRFMVRVGMMNPKTAMMVKDELVEAFRKKRIYKFIHMPVQSGSNRILERMRRDYSIEDYIGIVQAFREKLPDPSFATDIIVGFPGEQDEDFEKTLMLMGRTAPDKINITRYSKRPNTPSSELYDMPDRIKKNRSRQLTKLWQDIAGEHNRRYLGRSLNVLVTETGRDSSMKGRTENYLGVVLKGIYPLGGLQRVKAIGSNPFFIICAANHP